MKKYLLGTAIAVLGVTAAQAQDLLVFDYSGFEDPAFHQSFVATHGDSPEFTFFGDEEEAFQKIVSGFRSDVTHVCAGSVTKWVEAGIVEEWDTARIPEFANLNASLMGTEISPGEGAYFIPTDYGSTAIAYNTEEVAPEDVETLELFRNPAYSGRLTLPDNVDDAYALAYLATGVTNWSNATDEQFEAASAWLRAVHPNLRTYWVDPAELSQLLASGEVVAGWAWNETLPTMVEEGFPIGFQRAATEGSSLWLCGYLNMAEGEGSEDQAYDYINAILSTDSTAALLDFGYGHANTAGMGNFSEDDLTAAGIGTVDAPMLAQLPMPLELREKQSAAFERIKSGF